MPDGDPEPALAVDQLCGSVRAVHPHASPAEEVARAEPVVDRVQAAALPLLVALAQRIQNSVEHLITLDKDGKLVPRLATSWQWLDDRTLEVTLRQGVTFHNGEVFDAEIIKLNWDEQRRLEQPFRNGNFMNFKPGSRLEVINPYTVRFVFPEPDGGAVAKLTIMHIGNRQFYGEFGWGEKSW